ncbi:MAG: DUF3887 domain-containing protein [Bacteroidia bacterium]
MKLLKNHNFRKLHKSFDASLKRAVSVMFLKKGWNTLEKEFGKYKSHGQTSIVIGKEMEKYVTLIYFAKGSLVLETALNEKGKLSFIFLRAKTYSVPEYGKNLVYNKENITVSSGKYQLPGEIIYPKKLERKVPLVIFVHGSGANDREEEIGPVKVFKDLYLGLVSKGIACMIYDKRTLVYKQFDSIQYTLWDETVEDAVNAFKLAKSKPDVDTNQIFIIGHSQGGYALPLILKNCQGVKGGISLAGCSRPLDELIEYQYHFLTALDGKVSLSEKIFLKREMKKIKFVRSDKLMGSKPGLKILAYWPTAFWKDIRNYKPVEEMKMLDIPVLFLQGDRDYQVTNDDLTLWKSGYLEKRNWSFISYPKLNHLFIEGEGKSNPSEYWNGGNVPIYVIEDLVIWINGL